MRSQLEAYAKQLANGSFIGMPNHPPPSSRLSTRELERFLSNCASRFVVDHVPRLLYKQLLLYLQVAHSERTAVECARARVKQWEDRAGVEEGVAFIWASIVPALCLVHSRTHARAHKRTHAIAQLLTHAHAHACTP
eukprot:2533911-Pleurochrysis_carterae.AAC.1